MRVAHSVWLTEMRLSYRTQTEGVTWCPPWRSAMFHEVLI
jgi:hypothetical protein